MSPELKSELHYLASPYTHFEGGLENAFQEAAELAGRLLLSGVHCFSPIVHGHPLSQYGGVEAINHILWLEHDEKHMARCDAIGLAEPVSLAMPLLDLGYDQCRWPTHDAPALFCGHPQHATSSYCEYHFHRSRVA